MTDKPRAKCPVCGKAATRKISGGAGLVSRAAGSTSPTTARTGRAPESEEREPAKAGEAERGGRGRVRPRHCQAGRRRSRRRKPSKARQEGQARVSDASGPSSSGWPRGSAPTASSSCSSGRATTGHGDLATNLAMVLAKPRARPTRAQSAERVLRELQAAVRRSSPGPRSPAPASSTSGSPRMQLAALPPRILGAGRATTAAATAGAGLKVNVEFVSANPTGPLHVGHGRGAALGDAIASLLEWTGHAVTREFYINDAGVQIDRLAESLWARIRQAAGRPRDSGGRLPRRVPARERPPDARERGPGFAELPAEEGMRRAAARSGSASSGRSRTAICAEFGVRFDVHDARSRRSTTRAGSQHALELAGRARPDLRGRRRALAPHHAVRGRQGPGAAEERRLATPISCPTSPITSTSTTAASTGRSTSGAPITTATSRGCGRCCRRWAIRRISSTWRWCSWSRWCGRAKR